MASLVGQFSSLVGVMGVQGLVAIFIIINNLEDVFWQTQLLWQWTHALQTTIAK